MTLDVLAGSGLWRRGEMEAWLLGEQWEGSGKRGSNTSEAGRREGDTWGKPRRRDVEAGTFWPGWRGVVSSE